MPQCLAAVLCNSVKVSRLRSRWVLHSKLTLLKHREAVTEKVSFEFISERLQWLGAGDNRWKVAPRMMSSSIKGSSPIVALLLRGTNAADDKHRATSVKEWSSTWASYSWPCYKHRSIMVYNVEEEGQNKITIVKWLRTIATNIIVLA